MELPQAILETERRGPGQLIQPVRGMRTEEATGGSFWDCQVPEVSSRERKGKRAGQDGWRTGKGKYTNFKFLSDAHIQVKKSRGIIFANISSS